MIERKSILIVEDDKFLRDLSEKHLRKEGYEVLTAAEGEGALALSREKQPNLILLDVILPGLDGFEVLKILKSREETRRIPVILFTNLGSQEDMATAKALGADDFLVKAHHSLDDIVKKIRDYL